tara:strand:- start:491 stop:631 length:141 start_codon:yes stop_codon:yes gene_type:complete
MRGEEDEIIWEMIWEKSFYTFTNLKGDSRTKKRGDGHGLMVAQVDS